MLEPGSNSFDLVLRRPRDALGRHLAFANASQHALPDLAMLFESPWIGQRLQIQIARVRLRVVAHQAVLGDERLNGFVKRTG